MQSKKLKKELGLLHIFSIASGAMISSGLFILPGLAHAKAGPAVILSYGIAGLLALTGLLSQAELVSAMPKTGGDYFYVTRSMGSAAGTINGLVTWFSLSLKSAFALVGMAAFTQVIIGLNIHLLAIVLSVFFVLINIIGVKEAGRIQIILVVGLLLLLTAYVIMGIPAIRITNYVPFAPQGIVPVFSTAGFVFISYGGLLKVASIAEEIKNPSKTIPLGMLLSLGIVSIFYILVIFITSGVLDNFVLDESLTPISDGAAAFMGSPGQMLLSVAATLAFISTANAGIMAASRYPFALSRDGLLPSIFSKTNNRFSTPHISIFITGLFIIAVLFLDVNLLVKAASTVLLLSFLFACLSVIIMRESKLQNYDPQFSSPLYPWVQIIGVIGFILLITGMGIQALLMSGLLLTGGFFAFWFYGRIRTNREFALLHLIQRITAKELTGRSLEQELKEIIRERDELVKDRFDRIIENCQVYDLNDRMVIEPFFEMIANSIAPRFNKPPSEIHEALLAREKESSTIIRPGLAIPHIVIEGENNFDIVLARSKPGVMFYKENGFAHTIFVLIGTRDERNFYLRALAAIAQIAQNDTFSKKWMNATSEEDLRDAVLLGKRTRLQE